MTSSTTQQKQSEWFHQWSHYDVQEHFLFKDWISPFTMEDFRGKTVLEAGCGGGQYTAFMATFATSIVGVDLNTVAIARERNKNSPNVRFLEADIGTMDLKEQFDIVLSVGVVHHTDKPDRTVANLIRHVKPGGTIILWVYSEEGNTLVAHVIEPFRKQFLAHASRGIVAAVSQMCNGILLAFAHTLYRLPIPRLPYAEYLKNARGLSWQRNFLNVFDKLNAPQTQLISRTRADQWLDPKFFDHRSISSYCGVSWRIQGRRKASVQA